MNTYTVITYWPSWDDTCRGCLMERYDSSLEIEYFDNIEDLTNYLAHSIHRAEIDKRTWYERTILVNGKEYSYDYYDESTHTIKTVEEHARAIADEKTSEYNRKLSEKKNAEKLKEANLKREKDLELLAELKKKYEE